MSLRTAAVRFTVSGDGSYPERIPVRLGVADRALERLSHALRDLRGARETGDCGAYRVEVGRVAESLRGAPFAESLAILRYRLRRDGYMPDRIRDCLAHASLALENCGLSWPTAEAYVAAREQLLGRFVAVTDPSARFSGLLMAATSAAIAGDPVHLLVRDPLRAREVSERLADFAAPLSLRVAVLTAELDPQARRAAYGADIVCATVQGVGLDYLRDRLQNGTHNGELSDAARRMAGDAPRAQRLLLRGLHQAFIEDADQLMIDDARIPLVIAVDSEVPGERLLYEQALEFARALEAGDHFTLGEEGVPMLTESGRERLARLVSPLGGLWSAASRREELIAIALRALLEFQRERDYQIVRGRIEFPPPGGAHGDEPSAGDRMLIRLVEVKEGCALSGRREVLGRLSIPGFLGRYLQIAGVGADWRGIGGELHKLYGVPTVRLSQAQPPIPALARLFVSAEARRETVTAHANAALSAGRALLIVLRSPQDAEFWLRALVDRGMAPKLVRTGVDILEIARVGGIAIGCAASLEAMSGEPSATQVELVIPELPDSRRYIGRLCRACGATRVEWLAVTGDEALLAVVPATVIDRLAGRAGGNGEVPRRFAGPVLGYALRRLERELRIQREELVARDQYLAESLAFAARQT